ncbi:MAG: hypothetical protein K8F26_11705 [Thiobacillus sp.]|nr:hypothetical protein [Thiobacillus sp.]
MDNKQPFDETKEFEFTGNMPNIMAHDEHALYMLGPYTVMLSENLPSIAESTEGIELPEKFKMHYKYVLTVVTGQGFRPRLFVTLESFGGGPYMIGALTSGGAHSNYGIFDTQNLDAFIEKGFPIVKELLGIHDEPTRLGAQNINQPKNKDAQVPSTKPKHVPAKYRGQFAVLIIVALCVGSFLFYWHDYRPTQIRIKCEEEAVTLAMETMRERAKMNELIWGSEADNGFYLVSDKESHYKSCLRKNGLEQ